MAGTRRKSPAKFTVEKIKAGLIINRLEKHIFNHPGNKDFLKDDMTQSQVTAALGLIKKVHPDLASQKVEVVEPVRVEVIQVSEHKVTQ